MKFVIMTLHMLPTAAVLALAWLVVRAVSVRVVWRDSAVHTLDDEPA